MEIIDYLQRIIIFRDHFDHGAVKTVFLISNAFEEFLTINNIPYERKNFKR